MHSKRLDRQTGPRQRDELPRILNKLQGFGEDKQEFLDKLSRYDLLVIDDLGVERDTSYSVEQVFNVIDARNRTGKPLIVTTNLSLADLQNPSSLGYARIYDRILEMCPIRLKLAGDSRRTQNAQERRDKAKRLLGLERT
ncbi:MAG: ATP-binding protein [Dysosmobacter welbionis]